MKVTKKVFVSVLMFGMFCLFTTGALAIDVLYAPLEGFYRLVTGNTNVYVYDGVSLQASACISANGIIPVGGKVGKALSFNGKRYITVPYNPSNPWLEIGTDDFAITFWVKTKATKTNNTIIDKRKGHPHPGYHVTLYKGRPLLHMCQPPASWFNYWGGMTSTAVNDGKWHYVAIYVERENSKGGKIYVDGLCVHTFDPTNRPGSLNNGEDLLIGKHADSSRNNFEGTLDELWIFRGVVSRKAPHQKKKRPKIK